MRIALNLAGIFVVALFVFLMMSILGVPLLKAVVSSVLGAIFGHIVSYLILKKTRETRA